MLAYPNWVFNPEVLLKQETKSCIQPPRVSTDGFADTTVELRGLHKQTRMAAELLASEGRGPGHFEPDFIR